MKAKDFDEKFDQGDFDLIDDLDLSSGRRVNQGIKRINVDLPAWLVDSLDQEASLMGVTRQSVIKVWLVERIRSERQSQSLAARQSEIMSWLVSHTADLMKLSSKESALTKS